MPAKLFTPINIEVVPDENADTSYLEQEGFEDRLAAYRAGDFGFIGIRASCEIVVEGTIQTIKSAGLWGIEDDSDDSYLDGIAKGEREELGFILDELGVNVSAEAESKA